MKWQHDPNAGAAEAQVIRLSEILQQHSHVTVISL